MTHTPNNEESAEALGSYGSESLEARLTALHGSVHESLESQFGSTVADLLQLRNILGDATTKLSQAFQMMVHQARDQGEIAQRLLDERDSPAAREMQSLAKEISRGANLVVQSLQFEDMANQLLQHLDRRITWLESFARDASLLRTAVHDQVIGMSHQEFLEVEERISQLRNQRHDWDRKVVQQQSLEEGDIELF